MASDKLSLLLSLSSSSKACWRFLSDELRICILLSHVLNLLIVERVAGFRTFPRASLFALPMTVESPMSCLARESGVPALAFDSASNVRHSARISIALSDNTNPQLLQTI